MLPVFGICAYSVASIPWPSISFPCIVICASYYQFAWEWNGAYSLPSGSLLAEGRRVRGLEVVLGKVEWSWGSLRMEMKRKKSRKEDKKEGKMGMGQKKNLHEETQR